MPAPPSGSPRAAVIDALRAAGCVFAEDEADLLLCAAVGPEDLRAKLSRRTAGEPLEQVLGWAEFSGLRIALEPGVFVPRRRSEHLVAEAVRIAPARAVVVDLCCGSGAVGAAIHSALPSIELYAADIDPAAVRCARRNIPPASGQVLEGDLFDPLPVALRGRVDILAVNAPYVPTESIQLMPPEARLHEPRVALDGGAQGLDVQRRVAAAAWQWLAAGGHLLIETSRVQAPLTLRAVADGGLTGRVSHCPERDATVVIGNRPISG
ncbi:MAG: putative protein N(5)-glutamine methyltransferase [Sciscionella sp.]